MTRPLSSLDVVTVDVKVFICVTSPVQFKLVLSSKGRVMDSKNPSTQCKSHKRSVVYEHGGSESLIQGSWPPEKHSLWEKGSRKWASSCFMPAVNGDKFDAPLNLTHFCGLFTSSLNYVITSLSGLFLCVLTEHAVFCVYERRWIMFELELEFFCTKTMKHLKKHFL